MFSSEMRNGVLLTVIKEMRRQITQLLVRTNLSLRNGVSQMVMLNIFVEYIIFIEESVSVRRQRCALEWRTNEEALRMLNGHNSIRPT